MFGVSLGVLGGFIIGNGKGSLVGLSLVTPLVYPLGHRNHGYVMYTTMLGSFLCCGLAPKRLYLGDPDSTLRTAAKLFVGG